MSIIPRFSGLVASMGMLLDSTRRRLGTFAQQSKRKAAVRS